MISRVRLDGSTWAEGPAKFEAGTPNIADVVAFGAALDYLSALGMANVRAHETELTEYSLDALARLGEATVYGPHDVERRGGVVTFALADLHPHDVSQALDARGIAVRAGHHCAKPAHRRFGVQSSTRASSYLYTTPAEIDALLEGIIATQDYFKVR